MPRHLRTDAPDAVFHVTARVNWRVWHLEPDQRAAIFIRILDEAAEEFEMSLIADVLMSNHYHFVCQSPPPRRFRSLTSRRTPCRHLRPYPPGHLKASVLSQFMQKLMHRSSRAIQRQLDLTGHLWEKRYHARRVTDGDDLVTTVAYDHLNPVREDMARSASDYSRSSAAWWERTGDSEIRLLRRPLPFDLSTREFRERLTKYQTSREFRDVMRRFRESGKRWESAAGRDVLRQLLEEAGLRHACRTPTT